MKKAVVFMPEKLEEFTEIKYNNSNSVKVSDVSNKKENVEKCGKYWNYRK
jgi:protein tyrosine phosphatase